MYLLGYVYLYVISCTSPRIMDESNTGAQKKSWLHHKMWWWFLVEGTWNQKKGAKSSIPRLACRVRAL